MYLIYFVDHRFEQQSPAGCKRYYVEFFGRFRWVGACPAVRHHQQGPSHSSRGVRAQYILRIYTYNVVVVFCAT